jgi:hypothetical protein
MPTIYQGACWATKARIYRGYIAVRNVSSLYRRLKRSALGVENLADAFLEDLCMLALLLFLLFTTLLLPWLIL